MEYSSVVKTPKTIARITLCGCVHFDITDTMDFKRPTPEQIKNLRDMMCVDVTLFDEEGVDTQDD